MVLVRHKIKQLKYSSFGDSLLFFKSCSLWAPETMFSGDTQLSDETFYFMFSLYDWRLETSRTFGSNNYPMQYSEIPQCEFTKDSCSSSFQGL